MALRVTYYPPKLLSQSLHLDTKVIRILPGYIIPLNIVLQLRLVQPLNLPTLR